MALAPQTRRSWKSSFRSCESHLLEQSGNENGVAGGVFQKLQNVSPNLETSFRPCSHKLFQLWPCCMCLGVGVVVGDIPGAPRKEKAGDKQRIYARFRAFPYQWLCFNHINRGVHLNRMPFKPFVLTLCTKDSNCSLLTYIHAGRKGRSLRRIPEGKSIARYLSMYLHAVLRSSKRNTIS